MNLSNGYLVLTGTSNKKLAKEVGSVLKTKVSCPISKFADGEISVQIAEELFKKDVFIVQSTCPPVNKSIMELLLMIDAVKRSGCNEIIAVIPYFGYARQDRKHTSKVPISASLVARLIEYTGVHRIITIDIHSDQQQGFIQGPWENLYGSYSLLPTLTTRIKTPLVVASPDKGGTARAKAYASRLNAQGIAIVYKERSTTSKNESEALDVIGNVKNKNVLIVDDIIDTAGTICNAASLLKERGAKNIFVAATHGLFSKKAIERLEKAPIKKVFVTNTIPQKRKTVKSKKIKVLSVAPLISEVITRTFVGRPLSSGLINY